MENAVQRRGGLSPISRAILIWFCLVVLTIATVAFHEVHLILWGAVVALAIAATKSYLVVSYYMHLRYEPPALRGLVAMTLGILFVVLIFIFTDPLFR